VVRALSLAAVARVELVTSRLILREAEPDDALALASYQSDSRYREQYPESPGPQGEILDAPGIVRLARLWAADLPRLNYQLIITLGPGGQVIGCAGLRQAGYPPGEAEVGIELDPEYWGAGYARSRTRLTVHLGSFSLGGVPILARLRPPRWETCDSCADRTLAVRRAGGPARSTTFLWRPRCCWR